MHYDICPYCGRKLHAHKGHTKSFDQLSLTQKDNSIKMMTINLRRAILKFSQGNGLSKKQKLLWAINNLSKK